MDDTRSEHTLPSPQLPPAETSTMQPGALGAWWRQGTRTAFFLRPNWHGLQTTPATLAWLVAVLFGFSVLAQRLTIPGPATFYWPALQSGWLWSVVTVWVCWWQVPRGAPQPTGAQAPDAAALFALSVAQAFALELLLAVPPLGIAATVLRCVMWSHCGEGPAPVAAIRVSPRKIRPLKFLAPMKFGNGVSWRSPAT